jgi:hypothetical protein
MQNFRTHRKEEEEDDDDDDDDDDDVEVNWKNHP